MPRFPHSLRQKADWDRYLDQLEVKVVSEREMYRQQIEQNIEEAPLEQINEVTFKVY